MARIRIDLEPNETLEEIKDELSKAFQDYIPVAEKPFQDPALEDMYGHLNDKFETAYSEIFKEILEVIKLDDELLKLKKK